MMSLYRALGVLAVSAGAAGGAPAEGPAAYPWRDRTDPDASIARRIAAPAGAARAPAAPSSFATWLRGLPLKPGRPPVLLFDGREKANQEAHVAVVDLDTGDRDLQQCADAVIRLRAEYLFSRGALDAIHFDFTSGDRASYMPAQDVHVLRNPSDGALSPWYAADGGETLRTPDWTFRLGDLRRFEGDAP